eukprot:Colp12_sorted_trinity150504_noHs@24238
MASEVEQPNVAAVAAEPILSAELSETDVAIVRLVQAHRSRLENEIAQLKQEIATAQAEMEALESEDPDLERSNKEKRLNIGRKKFNMDPGKGMEYLIEEGWVEKDPLCVAKFLLEDEKISKRAIGDYLGEMKEFNLQVLNTLVDLQDFNGLTFSQAIRKYLSCFRLPGEAQKIDRMMNRFASQFFKCNPGIFASADTVYVLAFSTIMLNTDLHNPSVKNKMNLEGFVKNNRGINEGKDLPRSFLEDLYNDFLTNELEMPKEEDGSDTSLTFFNPEREGYLVKQGGRFQNWKRRWFILTGNCLYYFKNPTDSQPCGIIPLENLDVQEVKNKPPRPFCFMISNPKEGLIKAAKTSGGGTLVEGRHSVYMIAAANQDEMMDWMTSIRASIRKDPVYELLRGMREKVTQADDYSKQAINDDED